MSEQSGGPGWWLASDGRWYPPELAAPPAAPVSYPPPTGAAWTPSSMPASGPPPTPPGGRGVTAGIVIGGLLTLVVLALLVAGFVSRSDDDDGTDLQTTPPTTEGSTDDRTEDTTDGSDDAPSTTVAGRDDELPPGFELVQGDGVSVGLPEGWVHLSAEELDLPMDELAEIFPDLEPEVIDSFSTMLEQGAVLIAVDRQAPNGFGANINVLAIPGESDLDEIQSAAPGELESLGGVVTETTQVGLPAGAAVRIVYEISARGVTAEGAQYYLSANGRTYIVSLTAGAGDTGALGDQIMETFRIDG